ncbi:MAG: hypothetical protein D3911_07535 [Candidatus Electrothrix sp. AW3_4]|nr:hypothetical protein [Candidatus Electrothrix gigas]
MPKNTSNTSSDILKSVFHRSEKGFFRILEMRNLLTRDERSQLKITKRSNQKQVLDALETLTSPYSPQKKGSSWFILNKSPQDALLEYIAQASGQTIGEIAKGFPLKQEELYKEADKLVEQGTVTLKIQPRQKIKRSSIELHFYLDEQQGGETETKETVSPSQTDSDPVQAFKAAYDDIGSGRHFVKIFKIRRHLNLPREDFDNLIKTLANEEYIMLNMGNPGKLSEKERLDSFQDEHGNLYITVTWR